MCVGQRVGHVGRDAGRLCASSGNDVPASARDQCLDIVRNDVDLPIVQADVVDRHDAGVAELREPAGLLEEPLGRGGRHVGAAAMHLDGHWSVKLFVVAEVDRAEAAGSQGVLHPVTAEGDGNGWGDR